MERRYYSTIGGLPPQTELLTGRSVFTPAYAVIPRGVMSDIVASRLPFWEKTRAWVLARPLSGFAETFSHYVLEVGPGGGSERPEPDSGAEGVLFAVEGSAALRLEGETHTLGPGGYAYLAPGAAWSLQAEGEAPARLHWIRKRYEPVEGIAPPTSFTTSDAEARIVPMPDTEGRWSTTIFVDPADLAHDMQVNIVNFEPGGLIPFTETHVMEHSIFILEGKAVYRLNQDWVEVQEGDFLWLRAFCPQACYAGGPGRFRYLLYRDVNRHARLTLPPIGSAAR